MGIDRSFKSGNVPNSHVTNLCWSYIWHRDKVFTEAEMAFNVILSCLIWSVPFIELVPPLPGWAFQTIPVYLCIRPELWLMQFVFLQELCLESFLWIFFKTISSLLSLFLSLRLTLFFFSLKVSASLIFQSTLFCMYSINRYKARLSVTTKELSCFQGLCLS